MSFFAVLLLFVILASTCHTFLALFHMYSLFSHFLSLKCNISFSHSLPLKCTLLFSHSLSVYASFLYCFTYFSHSSLSHSLSPSFLVLSSCLSLIPNFFLSFLWLHIILCFSLFPIFKCTFFLSFLQVQKFFLFISPGSNVLSFFFSFFFPGSNILFFFFCLYITLHFSLVSKFKCFFFIFLRFKCSFFLSFFLSCFLSLVYSSLISLVSKFKCSFFFFLSFFFQVQRFVFLFSLKLHFLNFLYHSLASL
ncbi:unnamed protein product [Acanthosepion pharaonis]|uniref:Uncharacterized protein n=1 Tax=Acanthosepion pharaonis TaxID=158019 RepID=A0A812DF37_ACAPH|nr:unnamed protein product [Sepia pharaonis]